MNAFLGISVAEAFRSPKAVRGPIYSATAADDEGMALESRREVDTVLDTMLRREPAPQIAALNEQGLFVAMPASVPIREGCLIEGPTSGMQLVVASDIPVVIDTWARALLDGVASAPVQLLNSTGAQAELWIIDARHRYDVLLCLVIVPIPAGENAAPGPRVWNSTKDQLAVITDVDPSVREILGWRPDELIGRRSTEFIHPEDIPRATTLWMKMLGAPGARQRSRLRHLHRDGSWMWFEFTNHNRLGETGYGCVQSKMTEVGDLMAEIDPLTGSLNRSSILAALDGRLEAPCAAESGTAVILIHLDRLKRISDLSGYAGTDELLRQTSERLLDNARGEDAVGRLSDDEFLLVCDVSDEAEAAAIAERIGSALREIVEANSLQIEPTVSIGVAWTNGGMTAE
jgi:diguanylate cyclase (GGDEF)-like protein/PAS domain S-box-containing protein